MLSILFRPQFVKCRVSLWDFFFSQCEYMASYIGSVFCKRLTHWLLGDVAIILEVSFSNSLYTTVARALVVKSLSGECQRASLMKINIGSGNGLVPSGNKPLPEPVLSQMYVTIWHHQATMSSWSNELRRILVQIYNEQCICWWSCTTRRLVINRYDDNLI